MTTRRGGALERPWIAGVVALTLAACSAGELGPSAESNATTRGAAARLEAPLGPVSVRTSGDWQDFVRCDPACVYNHLFWVDLDVESAPDIEAVGIEYTTDNWATKTSVLARFEAYLGGGREQWGTEVALGIAQQHPEDVQVRAFVRRSGQVLYEPRARHIYGAVWPTTPVRLLSSAVTYSPETGAVMAGKIRVFEFDASLEKRVSIRYTLDGWATYAETAASPLGGDDWSFRLENLGGTTLPEGVAFAVRYSVPGEEFWDNNESRNYGFRLAPIAAAHVEGLSVAPGAPLDGTFRLTADVATALPLARVDARLDEGEWQPGASLPISTARLESGTHNVVFRATLEGGYETVTTWSFEVDGRVRPTDTVTLTPPVASAGGPVAIATDVRGRAFVLFPRGLVARYDTIGAAASRATYVSAAASAISVDEAGRLYTLDRNEPTLARYLPDGNPDRTFGDAGRIRLNDPANGGYFCSPTAVAAGFGYAYVADTCGPRVVRFTELGRYAGAVMLAPAGEFRYRAVALVAKEDGAMALSGDGLFDLTGAEGRPFDVASSAAVPWLQGQDPLAMAPGPNGTLWVLDNGYRVAALGADGSPQGSFRGAPTGASLEGELGLAVSGAALPDGAFEVVTADGKALTFAKTH